MAMRFHTRVLALSLPLLAGGALAEQVCKYDSIPATAPASRFIDNGNGTVTDKATGLQWKRCSEGQTWSGGTCEGTGTEVTYAAWWRALSLADAATFAGKSDWRLPNLKELLSILERACFSPAIDLRVFPGAAGADSAWHWSSSPNASNSGAAWCVAFGSGSGASSTKYNPHQVLLVRGGQ